MHARSWVLAVQTEIEFEQHLQQRLWQAIPALLLEILRDTVEAFRDGACDAGQGIAVAAQGNGGANHIFKAVAL